MARPIKKLEQYHRYAEIVDLIQKGISKRKIAKMLEHPVGLIQSIAKKAALKFSGKSGSPEGTRHSRATIEKRLVTHRRTMRAMTKEERIKKYARAGAKNNLWKGGLWKSKRGRWYIHDPSAPYRKIERARYVVQVLLGRKLENTEIVHHIDFNPENDSPSNLYLFSTNKKHLDYHRLIHKKAPIVKSNIFPAPETN